MTIFSTFHKPSTSLHLWFYAMYLMTSTRCGISAKQLERELASTARLPAFQQDPQRVDEGRRQPLKGDVEIDETSWGGRSRRKLHGKEQAEWRETKTTVLGMVERGGRVKLRVIASRRGEPLSGGVWTHVNPRSIIFTDDWMAYKPFSREYAGHSVINHSAGVYVEGDIYTNTIEGFFGNMKTGGCAVPTRRSRADGFSPIWTSMRGATTPGESRALFEQLLSRAMSG